MSFDYNPYEHIEVLYDSESNEYGLYCHSCGAEHIGKWSGAAHINWLFQAMANHVMQSHNRDRKFFEGWSRT